MRSLESQTVEPHEIIIEREKGPLAKVRNKGGFKATGDIICFIDDDVVCDKRWVESIVECFESRDLCGVSGPAIIDEEHQKSRDIFRHKWIKKIYDWYFLEGKENLPGHITEAGTWTTGACSPSCYYEGPVDFLEACNMSFRSDVFKFVRGFDESYGGVGDWSEPDLCFRIKQLGGSLYFSQNVRVLHNPSRTGAYKKRGNDEYRLLNYYKFSNKWVKPCFKNSVYKSFLRTYYFLKRWRLA